MIGYKTEKNISKLRPFCKLNMEYQKQVNSKQSYEFPVAIEDPRLKFKRAEISI